MNNIYVPVFLLILFAALLFLFMRRYEELETTYRYSYYFPDNTCRWPRYLNEINENLNNLKIRSLFVEDEEDK